MHEYNDDFYAYIGSGARRSAENIVPLVKGEVAIATMLDVGGGKGVWGKVWEEHGVFATVLDGDYVTEPLVEDFRPQDLSQPFDLGQRFDLVQTLEVAEHLPETSARDFVASIARHGDIVLFSAAVPGQGGEHHVNEQPLKYWRKLFAEAGYACFDALRPHLRDNKDVMPWYRYNILLFAMTPVRPSFGQGACRADRPSERRQRFRLDAAQGAGPFAATPCDRLPRPN